MTPIPPSSPDGSSLPPRHRPNMGNLAKDTTELDLWAFDDAEPDPDPAAESPASEPVVPSPRPVEKLKVRKLNDTTPPKRSDSKNSKIRLKSSTSSLPDRASKPAGDFDDLDHWEDTDPTPEPEDIPEETLEESPPPVSAAPEPVTPPADPQPNDSQEFAPTLPEKLVSESLHLRLNLTKIERAGLIALLAVLVIGAASVVIYSLGRLPTESSRVKSTDFPIAGKHLQITAADSHWRAPVTEGKSPDIVRRGTALLPVIDLSTSDGTAAIRVVFRNEDGESIGDIVTRQVQNGQKLEVAATAGFDDVGMHAAYRTGESKPWTVEVFEAPTVDSANNDFKKLFQMNISTDRR